MFIGNKQTDKQSIYIDNKLLGRFAPIFYFNMFSRDKQGLWSKLEKKKTLENSWIFFENAAIRKKKFENGRLSEQQLKAKIIYRSMYTNVFVIGEK